jgi:sugar phosphate isomerase/epimerase
MSREMEVKDPANTSSVGAAGLLSRREALALLISATACGNMALSAAGQDVQARKQASAPGKKPYLCLVSRHIQWTTPETGIEVAKQAGFPGILWTVRGGAHIEAPQVETELPRIVKLTRDAGLETPMVITAIGDTRADRVEAILATMQSLGIRLYRAVTPRYDYKSPIEPQVDNCRKNIAALAKLNEKYNVAAAFHTHSYANTIGGSGWDLIMAVQDADPRYVGLNYDIGHVTAKGGYGWRESVRDAGAYLHSVSVKDFYWEKEPSAPAGQYPWRTRFVRPGEGMVDFSEFFRYLQSIDFNGPLENYFEYSVDVPGQVKRFDMLGTNYKKWKLEMPEEMFVGVLKRDVNFYNDVWQQAIASPAAPEFSMKAGEA